MRSAANMSTSTNTNTNTGTDVSIDANTHAKPHVLILGGGIGGLTLAQCLRKRGISFEILERDSSDHARSQGWCIALHSIIPDLLASFSDDMPSIDTVNHLLPLNLPAQICMYPPPETTTMSGGEAAKMMVVQGSQKSKIIRANRAKLREWLSSGIDVQWGVKVVGIEEDVDDRKVRLRLADGTVKTGDVLVGADGVNSQVRKHLFPTDSKLLNTLPIGSVVAEPLLHDEDFEHQLKLGHSAYVAVGSDFHLFVGLKSVSEDGNSGRYYWFLNWHDENATNEPYWTQNASKEDLHAFALQKAASLDSKFVRIIQNTSPDEVRTPPIVFRDMELDRLPDSRVTLLGDAAHPMVPFRGEGGLHAMRDALSLSKALADSTPTNFVEMLDNYQHEMLARGNEAVRQSRSAFQTSGTTFQKVWGEEPEFRSL